MNLYEAIFSRKSVRSYEMEPVKAALLSEIREYYSQIEGLNPGIHTEISIIDNTKGQNKRIHLLGAKAPYYIAFYSEDKDRAMMNAGYIMEQLALFMCAKGLGTCFLSGVKPKAGNPHKGNLKFVILMAFGYSRGSHTAHGSAGALCVQGGSETVDEAASGFRTPGAVQYEQPAMAVCGLR